VARVKDLTSGLGTHSVIEAVGTQESMLQAIRATRPGGPVGYVGVLHDVAIHGEEYFFSHVHLHGGPAPVRRFLRELVDLIWNREIERLGALSVDGLDQPSFQAGVHKQRHAQRWGRLRVGHRLDGAEMKWRPGLL
jgi:threonine dehydrogenase-like Zn-dependent dehydrogenase